MIISRLFLPGLLAVIVGLAPMASAAELVPRGVFHWDQADAEFGGFSGLAMTQDGMSFLAVSDAGWMVQARLDRDTQGRVRAIATEWRKRFVDGRGNPVNRFKSDAEAVTIASDGSVVVAFESYTRIEAFHPPDMTPKRLHAWDRFRSFWGNSGLESLAAAPDGRLIAVLEQPVDGQFRTLIGQGREWRNGPYLSADGDFSATDATFGPDGRLYLLERSFAVLTGYTTRVRRFIYDGETFGPSETLMQTTSGALDNMEGISLWRDGTGQTVISLISDDNFLPVQNTLLAEYDLVE